MLQCQIYIRTGIISNQSRLRKQSSQLHARLTRAGGGQRCREFIRRGRAAGQRCKMYLKENTSFPPEYNRPVVIYIVCCRGESRCTFIYFMCHLQLSVDGQGSGREAGGGCGRCRGATTLPSHYKTVRSSANSVMVFAKGALAS